MEKFLEKVLFILLGLLLVNAGCWFIYAGLDKGIFLAIGAFLSGALLLLIGSVYLTGTFKPK